MTYVVKYKPSVFSKVINFFSNAFSQLVNGMQSAFLAIQHAFDSRSAAENATLNIRAEVTARKSTQQTSPTTNAPPKKQEANAGKAQVSGIVAAAAPAVDSDADDQLKIKAAATRLNEQAPIAVTLESGGVREVAVYSIDDKNNFLAWRKWKDEGILPGNGIIDLDAANRYGNFYLEKHREDNSFGNDEMRSTKLAALVLFAKKSEYETMLLNPQESELGEDIAELKKPDKAP
jgi:hypothetical protein